MRIYSWNVYYHCKTPEKQLEYIKHLDFDVLCLQEVPEHLLKHLRVLPYYLVSATDISFFSKKKEQTIHSVIISRYPIRAWKPIVFPKITLPPQTRILLKMHTGWSGFRRHGSVYADIDTGDGVVRVFSLHLSLSNPSDRKRQLKIVGGLIPKKFPVVVAGDFNIIERSSVKLLSWFTGSSVREMMPWHRERAQVEAQFKEWRLANPLHGKVTHAFSHSQLDHILVPQGTKVAKAEVIRKTYKSDHHPVFVEIAQ